MFHFVICIQEGYRDNIINFLRLEWNTHNRYIKARPWRWYIGCPFGAKCRLFPSLLIFTWHHVTMHGIFKLDGSVFHVIYYFWYWKTAGKNNHEAKNIKTKKKLLYLQNLLRIISRYAYISDISKEVSCHVIFIRMSIRASVWFCVPEKSWPNRT